MEGGKTLNKNTYPVLKAWVNLYIAITTNDINEFYKALGGNVRNSNKHYTWDEVNRIRPKKKGK